MASKQVMNAQPEFTVDETNNYLYNALWKLCAGPLFDLPKFGEKVYYFPQGHIEQLVTSIEDELCQVKPIFNIPSKIQCHVVGIQLKVENNTNELYAEVSLLPDTPEFGIPIINSNKEIPRTHFFTKVLSASDTSTHGGLSLIKRHAIECLPPLDMSQPIPTQEIIVKDLYGHEWKFKHSFRGTPRRHLFTTGWNAFAKEYDLVAGDSFIFIRGENGESLIGIRRGVHQQSNMHSSCISKENMLHGIIATALDAITNNCMFVVFCKPRSSQFVISFEKFVDAVNKKFNIGSRFTMQFENKDFTKIRYSGTVVGLKDFSHHWENSEWRNLEVQWDEAAIIPIVDKISPWDIEYLTLTSNNQSTLLKNKRARQVDELGSIMWTPKLTQGQEIGQSSMNSPMNVPQLSYCDEIDASKISSGLLMSRSYLTMSKPNYIDQMVLSMKEKITTNTHINYRLFGVDLANPIETKELMGAIDSNPKSKTFRISEEEKVDQLLTLTSPKEIQSKQIHSTRSCTKVRMEGVTIGRAVDLTVFDGYNQLIDELEKIFNLKGELHARNEWEIVFEDHERDMMLVGDDPWSEFCNMVKKIVIRPKRCLDNETREISEGA